MAKKQIEFKTEKNQYVASTLPALVGAGILQKIIKIVAPSLGEGIDNTSGASFSGFAGIAEKFVAQLDDDMVIETIQKLLVKSNIHINGNVLNFDEDFSANYDELMDVVIWLVEENFGSFFTKARSKILGMMN